MGLLFNNINLKKQKVAKLLGIYLFFALLVLILFWGFTSHMYINVLIAIALFVILDIALFVFLRKVVWIKYKPQKKWVYTIGYFFPFLLILITAIVPYFHPYPDWDPVTLSRFIGVVFVIVLVKGIFCLVYSFGITHFIVKKNITNDTGIPFKRLFRYYATISYILCVTCIITLGIAFLYAEQRVDVDKTNIPIHNLPNEFNNYKIVHITDLHLGSVNEKTIKKVVELINNQNADMVCFTGDIVTYSSVELKKYIPILRKIKAKDGVFAVLGNHDYGTYSHSKDLKPENEYELIKQYISNSLHWRLLLNEKEEIQRNNNKIIVAGIENMSVKKRFISKGDLAAALKNIDTNNKTIPVILLSHNPDIWTPFIAKNYSYVNLTLSGHTHGMQFGIHLNKGVTKESKQRQRKINGLYKQNNQYLYVSKGIGSSILHGRLGMWADISVITLTK